MIKIFEHDLVIIGGGPAGLAAAVSAYDNGITDTLIIERDDFLGGILQQCIHNGFGLTRFKENMTGPEYAARFIEEVKARSIKTMLNTMVLGIMSDKTLTATNEIDGIFQIKAKAIILAMGCRERSKGALNIAGYRPSGLFSAGTAQKYINMRGEGIGKDVVILGSGDIGLIMARRMTLEGAKVHAVCELMPFSSGLKRNIVQCLDDFSIPLYLSHTITKIHGKSRVEGVTISKVDTETKKPINGSEFFIKCDTVLFSVGLIPENELTEKLGAKMSPNTRGAIVDETRQTSIDGVFACGNVLHVHDLVDFVSEEAELAGYNAAHYIQNGSLKTDYIEVKAGKGVLYVVPQQINRYSANNIKLFFRPNNVYKNVSVNILSGETPLISKKKLALAPGEMENIIINNKELQNIKKELTVNIKENEHGK